jgi:hypothetical protein
MHYFFKASPSLIPKLHYGETTNTNMVACMGGERRSTFKLLQEFSGKKEQEFNVKVMI